MMKKFKSLNPELLNSGHHLLIMKKKLKKSQMKRKKFKFLL